MTKAIIHAIVLNADEYDEGLKFSNLVDETFITHAFLDVDSGEMFYLPQIDDSLYPVIMEEGLKAGLEIAGDCADIIETIIYLDDEESDTYYPDIRAAINRWIEEELDE